MLYPYTPHPHGYRGLPHQREYRAGVPSLNIEFSSQNGVIKSFVPPFCRCPIWQCLASITLFDL